MSVCQRPARIFNQNFSSFLIHSFMKLRTSHPVRHAYVHATYYIYAIIPLTLFIPGYSRSLILKWRGADASKAMLQESGGEQNELPHLIRRFGQSCDHHQVQNIQNKYLMMVTALTETSY